MWRAILACLFVASPAVAAPTIIKAAHLIDGVSGRDKRDTVPSYYRAIPRNRRSGTT
jgi:hypothetical protein